MFVSKRFHQERVNNLEDRLIQAALTQVRELRAKDLHISALEARISDLQRLVFIPLTAPTHEALEADAILSGSDKPVEMTEEEQEEIKRGEQTAREIDRILSGNYEEAMA